MCSNDIYCFKIYFLFHIVCSDAEQNYAYRSLMPCKFAKKKKKEYVCLVLFLVAISSFKNLGSRFIPAADERYNPTFSFMHFTFALCMTR